MTTHRIFVAGGTGVLGRRAVRALVAAGHDVTVLARSREKAESIRGWGATPAEIDLFDAAGRGRRSRGPRRGGQPGDPHPPHQQGRHAGRMEGERPHPHARVRGTWSTPRSPPGPAVTSRSRSASSTPTAATPGSTRNRRSTSSATSTPLTASLGETERFTAAGGVGVFLRFGMFYAPDAHHVIDQVAWARRGVSMEAGALDAYKSMVHADDAAAAVVAALQVPAGIYNVVDDEPLTRGEHIALTAELVGRAKLKRVVHRMRHLAGSKVDVLTRSQRVSNRRFREASGWTPRYPSIREGYPVVFAEVEAEAVAS